MSQLVPDDYAATLTLIKGRVRSAQYEALKAVNKELIALYWDIGKIIVERQQGSTWGKSVVEQLARISKPSSRGCRATPPATSGICGLFT